MVATSGMLEPTVVYGNKRPSTGSSGTGGARTPGATSAPKTPAAFDTYPTAGGGRVSQTPETQRNYAQPAGWETYGSSDRFPSSQRYPTSQPVGTLQPGGQGIQPGRTYNTEGDVPVRYDPARFERTHGTPLPDFDLPTVRVPGVEIDPNDFAYRGRTQGSYGQEAGQYAGREALQGNFSMADAARAQQLGALSGQFQQTRGMMEQAALGQAPSLAEAQLQGGVDRSIQAQMAMANAARGGGAARAGAMRQAALSGADMQAGVANQAAQLRAQEMATARGQLLGADTAYQQALAGLRGADQSQAGANLTAALQSRSQNDQMVNALYGYGNQAATAEMQGRQAGASTAAQADIGTQLANANLQAGKDAQNIDLTKGVVQGGLGAGGTILGATMLMSDRRAKTKVEEADEDVDDFLKKLRAYSYEYTKEAKAKGKGLAPEGKHTSVMAQDLERSKAGKGLVSKHESGFKAVDYGKALPLMLASLGRLNAKVSSLAEATSKE